MPGYLLIPVIVVALCILLFLVAATVTAHATTRIGEASETFDPILVWRMHRLKNNLATPLAAFSAIIGSGSVIWAIVALVVFLVTGH